MRNPCRRFSAVTLAACLALAGCSNTVVIYVTPAPTPVSDVTDNPFADSTFQLVDCAIQLRYDNVTVILRHTLADECAGAARGPLAFMGTWYAINPDTATQHKNLICKANHVGMIAGASVVGTPVEVWDTGGATLGSEICREWNLFT